MIGQGFRNDRIVEIIKTIEFMFAGINMTVLGPTQTHFSPSRQARVKMSSEKLTQNIFMPKNIHSITIIITFEGIKKINTENMTTKHSEQYFLCCK